MTVHHVDIYHCQKCGRVVSREHERHSPKCCGTQMSAAVANITYEDDRNDIGTTDEVIARSHSSNRCRTKSPGND